MNEKKQHSVALSILLIAVCLLSFLWVSRVATDNAIFTQMNKTIDTKEQNVMALSAGTMGVSVAITLIPGDTGTTLAEKLSDMSGYMFLVLIGLYLEKILLLLSGTIAFRVLIPIGCIFCLYHLFFDRGFVSFDEVPKIRKEIMAQRAAQFGKRIPKDFLEEEEEEDE